MRVYRERIDFITGLEGQAGRHAQVGAVHLLLVVFGTEVGAIARGRLEDVVGVYKEHKLHGQTCKNKMSLLKCSNGLVYVMRKLMSCRSLRVQLLLDLAS